MFSIYLITTGGHVGTYNVMRGVPCGREHELNTLNYDHCLLNTRKYLWSI